MEKHVARGCSHSHQRSLTPLCIGLNAFIYFDAFSAWRVAIPGLLTRMSRQFRYVTWRDDDFAAFCKSITIGIYVLFALFFAVGTPKAIFRSGNKKNSDFFFLEIDGKVVKSDNHKEKQASKQTNKQTNIPPFARWHFGHRWA